MTSSNLKQASSHNHAGEMPRLLHQFRINYEVETSVEDTADVSFKARVRACAGQFYQKFQQPRKELCVLAPGQLLPVWDLERWRQIYSFEAQSITALMVGSTLVTAPNFDSIGLDEIRESVDLEKDFSDPGVVMMRRRLQGIPLGNIGGSRIVRPDLFPIGVVPMEARSCNAERTHRFTELSVFDWGRQMRNLTEVPLCYVKPAFYVEGQGPNEGWDLHGQQKLTVREIPLPFLWSSAAECGLVPRVDDVMALFDRETALALAMSHNARQVAVREHWEGKVYLGFGLVPPGTMVEIPEQPVSESTYDQNRSQLETLYALPFVRDNPMSALNQNALGQAKALREGRSFNQFPDPGAPRKVSMAGNHLASL